MISQQRSLVRMPDIVGMPLRKAKLILENAGLAGRRVGVPGELRRARHRARRRSRCAARWSTPARRWCWASRARATSSGSRRCISATTSTASNFVRDILLDHPAHVRVDRRDPGQGPQLLRSVLGARGVPALAGVVVGHDILDEDWPLTKKRRLIPQGDRALPRARHRQGAQAVPLDVHRRRARASTKMNGRSKAGASASPRASASTPLILPPVNLAHAFMMEIPIPSKDFDELMVRIHEIIQMEKPANCQYYLRFAVDAGRPRCKSSSPSAPEASASARKRSRPSPPKKDLAKMLAGGAPEAASPTQRTIALPAVGAAAQQKGAPPETSSPRGPGPSRRCARPRPTPRPSRGRSRAGAPSW